MNFVRQRSGPLGAVVMGAFYTGPEYMQGDTRVLTAVSPDIFAFLRAHFSLGVSEQWPWACTDCSSNPWHSTGTSDSWTTHIWTTGIARNSVRDTKVLLTDAVVPLPSEDSGLPAAPMSPRYALESVIPILP